jgi:diguanylate cyclase (GGDEF)-like protein
MSASSGTRRGTGIRPLVPPPWTSPPQSRDGTWPTRSLAHTDSLTGLESRTHILELAEARLAETRDTASPVSAVIVDIDHFKTVNDTVGHAAGDAALRSVAEVLQVGLRPGDHAGRYGGDEF